MHDPRVGRFFAVDLLNCKFHWNTTYAFSANRVMKFIELQGAAVYLSKVQKSDYGKNQHEIILV